MTISRMCTIWYWNTEL